MTTSGMISGCREARWPALDIILDGLIYRVSYRMHGPCEL
jgi:hypothetical protein